MKSVFNYKEPKFWVIIVIVVVIGATAVSLMANPGVNINWDEVNAALSDRGYATQSLKEAQKISGYTIPIPRNLPSEISTEPYFHISKTPLMDNPPFEVMVGWNPKEEFSGAGFFQLRILTLPEPSRIHVGAGDTYEIVEINRIDVQKFIREDGLVFAASWYEEGIDYHIAGAITDVLTVEVFMEIIESMLR